MSPAITRINRLCGFNAWGAVTVPGEDYSPRNLTDYVQHYGVSCAQIDGTASDWMPAIRRGGDCAIG